MELIYERSFDEEFFDLESAIAEFGQPILRYCHAMLCDYHEAQDAVQLVFIKAHSKQNQFKTGTNLSAWLYKIAYSTCLDILRREKRRIKLVEDLKKQDAQTKDSGLPFYLEQALSVLNAKDRALVFSRAVDEMDYSELEGIYGAKAATLRKRYERAKKKLLHALTEGRDGNE